ncbi:hypothetical protein OIU92_21145 [Escherichia coli]|nr:hypothetical protein [Escherichia coli]
MKKDLAELDLSAGALAGIGAEPISAEQLHQFAECFRQVNFDDKRSCRATDWQKMRAGCQLL